MAAARLATRATAKADAASLLCAVDSIGHSAVRRYLLERYGAELHPKIRFQLLAKEHRSNQRLALSLKKARRLAH